MRLLPVRTRCCYVTQRMADASVLDEAIENLRKAGRRIRATQTLMRSQGTLDNNYRKLTTRLSATLAMGFDRSNTGNRLLVPSGIGE
jgi:hypothetical protein